MTSKDLKKIKELKVDYVDLNGTYFHVYVKPVKIIGISEEFKLGELVDTTYVNIITEDGQKCAFNETRRDLRKFANELGFLHPEELVGETIPFLYRETILKGIVKKIIGNKP